MFLIKNGYVMDPESGMEKRADILIEKDKIKRIGDCRLWQETSNLPELEIYDAAGLVVAPGFVDIHVHFRDPGFTHKEDIETGSMAAAAGGFTTVVLMANTKPVVDNEETLHYVLEKGKKSIIHIETCASITKGLKGKELVDMEALKEKGAVGFTDDGIPLLDADMVKRAMEEACRLAVPLSFHEENPEFIKNNGIHEGKASAYFGIGGSSREAEINLVKRDIALSLETGASINIQHISSKEAVEFLRKAKEKGGRIYAEAAPHHFALTEEAVIAGGSLAKMNPPLREEADRLAIIEGLRDNTIDFIATDHAPHAKEEKEKPLTEAPSGIIGLETALSLGITKLVKPGYLSLRELLLKMTGNPAKFYGLDAGYLAEGGPADMVLFDEKENKTITGFHSKSCNSPFLGQTLQGVVKCTICRGKIVYEEKGNSL